MDYDRSHVEFEVGALYYISYLGFWRYTRDKMDKILTLYIGFARRRHIFYIFEESRSIYIGNTRAIRMINHITKVETDVTVTAR